MGLLVKLRKKKKKRAMPHLVCCLCSLSFFPFLPGMRKCWLEVQQPLCECEAALKKEDTAKDGRKERQKVHDEIAKPPYHV